MMRKVNVGSYIVSIGDIEFRRGCIRDLNKDNITYEEVFIGEVKDFNPPYREDIPYYIQDSYFLIDDLNFDYGIRHFDAYQNIHTKHIL